MQTQCLELRKSDKIQVRKRPLSRCVAIKSDEEWYFAKLFGLASEFNFFCKSVLCKGGRLSISFLQFDPENGLLNLFSSKPPSNLIIARSILDNLWRQPLIYYAITPFANKIFVILNPWSSESGQKEGS